MAIISSQILISSLSLIHLTIAYLLHTSPAAITRHGMVLVLGSAFQLPLPTSMKSPSTATSWLGCMFALVGLMDLFSANLQQEVGILYWSSQAPLRTFFFMVIAGVGWLQGPKGLQNFSGYATPGSKPTFGSLSDGIIFTWAFLELVLWFWVFLTVRDERRAIEVRRAGGNTDA